MNIALQLFPIRCLSNGATLLPNRLKLVGAHTRRSTRYPFATTLLLGHPGEMEQDVEELKRFVVETRFERLGAFSYSDEEGTYANLHYSDHISQEEKQRRVDAIMSIQQQISEELMHKK